MLACDLDGTLLDETGNVRPSVRDAIDAIRASGVHVVLATGRSPWAVAPIARALGLNSPQITMNGSAYISPMTGEVVWARKLGRDLVLDGLAFAREIGAAPLLGFVDRLVAEAPRSRSGDGQDGDGVLPDFAVGPHVRLAETLAEIAGEGPSRLYIPTNPRDHATILAAARRRFRGRASIVYSDTSGFELLAPNTNKGHALRALAASLGVERSRVAAIGDGPNDREMLEWAGRSGLLLPFTATQREAAPPRSCAGSVFSRSADDGALEAMRAFFPAVDLEGAGRAAATVAA